MERLKNRTVSVLKWLEKYTKTDMVYLAKGGFWGIVSQITTMLMVFGLAVAFGHLVPKDTYGQYKYVLSIVSLLGTLSLTGLGTATLQSITRGYEGTLKYAFWQNIRWSIFFFIGSGLVSVYYFLHGNLMLGLSMLMVGCLWPFFNSTNLYESLLIAKKDFRRSSIYFDIIGNLVPYACLFGTMFLTKNPLWFVAVYIISNTLIGLILYLRIVSIYKPNDKVDPHMMNYSKHLSAMSILSGISENLDQILVFHYVGAVELAIYNFATAIPDQIKGPIKNLSNLIFPKFAERTDKEIKSGMNRKLLVLLAVSVVIIVAYIIAAPFIFKIFFPKYLGSIIYSQIFSVSLLSTIAIPANTYLSARKKIKELYIINLSSAIFQIIVLFVSVIYWGVLGLVIARVLTRIVTAMFGMFFYEISARNLVEPTQ